MLPRKQQDLPSSWGTSIIPFAHVPNRRRQDCLHQTITVQPRGPWSSKGKGSHIWDFRRSIAWLSDSLFTLRSAGYPTTTQNSLPVAGQALLDGVRTRKVPMKGFKVVNYISFPFPKLCLAQLMHPQQFRQTPNCRRGVPPLSLTVTHWAALARKRGEPGKLAPLMIGSDNDAGRLTSLSKADQSKKSEQREARGGWFGDCCRGSVGSCVAEVG